MKVEVKKVVKGLSGRRCGFLLVMGLSMLALGEAQDAPSGGLPLSTPGVSQARDELLQLLDRVQAQIEAIPDDATGDDAERLAALQSQLELILTRTQLERLQRENAALRAQLAAQGRQAGPGGGDLAALEQRVGDVSTEQQNLTSQLQVIAEQHAMILGSAEPPATHVVVAGDTLSALAETYLGSAESWPELLAANPDLTNADQLLPGTRLTLPPSD